MIRISQVSKNYLLGETTVHALADVSADIATGEFMAITGPSGSGKSTLLNLIGCIEQPSSGGILIDDRKISDLSHDEASAFRLRQLGFIFQTFNLLSVLTAFENVEYPLHLQKIPEKEKRERVLASLEDVGMAAFSHHKPSQLSGGQRQRVAIARALVGRPSIILADEPTANLDQATAKEIVALLKQLHTERGVTVIFSTHDPHIITQANRVIRLESGYVS